MSLKADLNYAIREHSAWKTRFRDFLNGKASLNVPSIGESHHCNFGKWLEAEGQRMLAPQDIEAIRKLHVEFHHVAAEVVRKIKQKDFAGAGSDIAADGAFNLASHTLITYLLKAPVYPLPKSPAVETVAEEKNTAKNPPIPAPPEDAQ